MKLSVIGAGAIGGWLTAGFVKGGAEATVLARGATLEALQRDGLHIDHGVGPERIPVRAVAEPEDLRGADLLLLGVKAHDLPALAPTIARALTPGTQVMPAVNGLPFWFFQGFGGPAEGLTLEAVDPGGVLARLMPVETVIANVVHAASRVDAPGHIRLIKADRVLIGGASPMVRQVSARLAAGGLPAEPSVDIHREVWAKLWGNSNMNPISALARADVAQILSDPGTHGLIAAMMREMAALGTLIGLTGFDDIEGRMAMTARLGAFKTSMLQDVEAGRAIELGPILGGLVELAGRLDHPVPVMAGISGLAGLLDRNLRGG